MAKYISGKFKNLKVGIKDYSEGKVALNVVGIISAASYQSGSSGITSTGATFHDLNVTGVSTFAGNINANGNIVGDNATNITGVYDVEIMNDLDIAGNIVGTNSNISGINSVTATTFYGDGSNLTGIDGVSDGDKGDVVVSAGGTIWNLDTTGVTAGSYNNANITVDAKGRLTAASSGSGGGDANYALTAGIATNVIGGIGSLTQLHVSGITTLTANASALNVNSNTTNPAINIQFSGTTKGSLTPLSDGLGIEASGGNDIILKSNAYGGTSGDIFLQSGSTKVITAKGTGEVGIGTDDPGSKLDVHGDVNVTGVSTLSSLDVTGNVSVGGTLTYEDVTNIDSVGFITARSGLNVLGSGTTTTTLNVTGVTTLGTYTHADRIYLGSGNSTYIEESSGINLRTNASKNIILGVNASGGSGGSIILISYASGSDSLVVYGNGNVAIANSLSIARSLDVSGISSVGAAITMYGATGIVSATKYYGDGSSLTNLPSSGISGITIEDEGSALATLATTLDFVGDGVVASGTGAEKTITIAGGGGTWNQDAEGNLVAGTGAGAAKDSDTCFNVMIGCCAGALLDSGDHNILLGCQAGAGLTSGFNNVMLGECAGYDTTIGEHNVFLGCAAGRNNVSGDNNFAAGPGAFLMSGASQKSASNNIAIGKQAASRADEGTRNITLGVCAGYWNSSGDDIIALGYSALCCNISGNHNIGLGCGAGYKNETGSYNVFMGNDAGKCLSNGNYHVAIGHQAARNCAHSTTDAGVYIGRSAGKGADGNWNVLIGCAAGECATGGGGKVGLGACALRNDRGNYNIGLGFAAGSNLTGLLANRNIAIGCNVSLPSADGENQLAIGQGTNYWIVGDSDYNVGIGTTIPNDAVGSGLTSKLSVGIVSAFTFYGDGSNLTGTGGETLISGITVKEEGSTVGTAGSIKNINFIGDSVTASASGSDTANITITGGAPGDAGYWVKTDVGIHTLSKVGIGTTNPLTNLDVHDEVSFASTVSIGTTIDIVPNNTAGTLSFNGSAGTLLSLSNDLTTGSIFSVADVSGFGAIDVYADRKIAMAYVSAGDSVGIGTTNPLEKLHVVGVVSATSFFGDGSGLTNLPSSGSSYWVKTDAGIHTTSKVGIGTTNPLFNLDVGSYVSNNVSTASTIRIIGENNSTAIRIGPGGTSNDITLIRVDSKDGTTDGTGNTDLGHSLKYMGSGSGADNRLAFWVDNTSNTAYEAVSIYNDGKFVVDGDPSGGGHGFHGTPTDAFTVRGTSKFTDGVCVTGVVTATSFSGSGANLSGVGFSPDAQENLYAGTGAGAAKDSDTCFNIMLGCNSGAALNAGDHNILLGCRAGYNLNTGPNNVLIGKEAGKAITTGCNNVALGVNALNGAASDGSFNKNIGIGWDAGKCLTSGDNNVFIGADAGMRVSSAWGNIALGSLSGACNCTGRYNVTLGQYAGYGITSGCDNIMIGCASGNCHTGCNNIMMGKCVAGNTAAGISTGSWNIVLGNCALHKIYCGNDNIALGRNAGCDITTGDNNILIGAGSSLPINDGSNQLVIGINTVSNWIVGNADFNVGIGTTNPNAAVGSGNTAKLSVGIVSAYQLFGDGSALTGISGGGFSADADLNLFASNTCSGCNLDGTNGCFNILLGACAGKSVDTGAHNVFLGDYAGMTPGDSQYNVYIGHNAGKNANEAVCCSVFIGANAGCKKCGTNSNCSVAIGANALKDQCGSYHNVAIGYMAMEGSNSSGVGNVAVGLMAGRSITSAQSNVLIGEKAGDSLTSGGGNVFLGKEAGHCGTSDLKFNVFVGCSAGYNQTAGCQNVLLGCRITAPITDGSHQMGIGNETSYNTGVSKYWIMGNSNYNVGIGTTNPEPAVGVGNTAKLSVGIVSAFTFYGDGSNLTGVGGVSGVGTFDAAAGVAHTINSYTIASETFETSEYTIFAGIGSGIQSQKILVMEDGTTAYSQEYGVMYNNDNQLVSASARIVSGDIRVEVTPETGVTGLTTYRFSRQTT